LARQCAGVHAKKIHNHLSDVLNLDFPAIGATRGVIVEFSRNGSRHNSRYFNAMRSKIQHRCLGKSSETELACVVGRCTGEEVCTRQAGYCDDVAFAFLERFYTCFDTEEHASKTNVYCF